MYLAHCRRSRPAKSPFLSDLLPLLVALEAKVQYATTPDGDAGMGARRGLPEDRRARCRSSTPCWCRSARRGDRRRRSGGAPAAERQAAGERRLAPRPRRRAGTTIEAPASSTAASDGVRAGEAWEHALRGRALDQLRTATTDRGLPDDIAECATTNFPPENIAPMTGEEIPAADRRRLARDLFQRFVVQGFKAGPGSTGRSRAAPRSSSEDDDEGPLGEGMPKLEGKIQTAGQALYTADLAGPPGHARGLLRHQHEVRGDIPLRISRARNSPAELLANHPDFVDYIAADVLCASPQPIPRRGAAGGEGGDLLRPADRARARPQPAGGQGGGEGDRRSDRVHGPRAGRI